MPLGLGAPGPMGSANPQNLQALAAAGDPRAIAMLQQMGGGAQGGMPPQGGGMPPPGAGGPPPGAGGGMPPMGAMPPAGGAPPMSQSQFGNGGGQPPADVQARRAAMLIQMLRARGDAQ